MSRKNIAVIAPAAVAGLLVIYGIVLSSNPAFAVDECLAAPNAPAPAGSHWYYRLERSTEHKCWYVREQRQETRAAPPKMRPTAVTPAPQATQTAVDQSTPIEQVERETQTTQPAWTPGEQTPTVAFVAQTSDAPASANAIQAEQSVTDRPNAQAASSAIAAPDAAGETAGQATIATETAKPTTPASTRMLLIVPAVLAFAGVFSRVVFSSAFGRQRIDVRQRASDWGAGIADLRQSPIRFNNKIAAPDQPLPQIEMPEDLKQTLRQVLQSLEARAA
jgi:hypothetical protein